jgi:bacillopeptidase F
MRTLARRIGVVALVAFSGCAGGMREVPPAALPLPVSHLVRDRIEPAFRARLAEAPARRFVAVVDLTEQLDLQEFVAKLDRTAPSRAARRRAIIDALEHVATRQQARVRPLLDRLASEGSIGPVRPVAIVNRFVVEGTGVGLGALADSPEVARIVPDWTSDRAATRDEAGETGPPLGDSFRSWAVADLRADRLWARGFDGRGVVVATIDTGAYEAHEQLAGRRLPGERGWFDPVKGTTIGTDEHGHGTSVLSQAVGANPSGRVVGVAPGAQWAVALGNWHNFYSRSRMTLAADWVLRVARPDVLINAWSHDESPCCDFDKPFIDAWRASGIFVVFPAGNAGPEPASGESPAQLPGVFSVSGLSVLGEPGRMSSRGPSRCSNRAFPSLAAPDEELPAAALGGPRAYTRGRGTSLAAGLIGGAAALLFQAMPEATPKEIEEALVRSARDVPPPGRDDATGAGAIDVEAALELLLTRPPAR